MKTFNHSEEETAMIDQRLAATIDALDLEFDGNRDEMAKALRQGAKANPLIAAAIKQHGAVVDYDPAKASIAAYDAEIDEAVKGMLKDYDTEKEATDEAKEFA
jgi:hypothetical protein